MVFLFSELMEEVTPKNAFKFDGSDPKKPLLQVCQEYEAS